MPGLFPESRNLEPLERQWRLSTIQAYKIPPSQYEPCCIDLFILYSNYDQNMSLISECLLDFPECFDPIISISESLRGSTILKLGDSYIQSSNIYLLGFYGLFEITSRGDIQQLLAESQGPPLEDGDLASVGLNISQYSCGQALWQSRNGSSGRYALYRSPSTPYTCNFALSLFYTSFFHPSVVYSKPPLGKYWGLYELTLLLERELVRWGEVNEELRRGSLGETLLNGFLCCKWVMF